MSYRLNNHLYEPIHLEVGAVGAGNIHTSPAGDNSRRLITNFSCTLTTAAVAATRLLVLEVIRSGSAIITGEAIATQTQIISLIFRYNWGIGLYPINNLATAGADRWLQQPLNPELWLEPADQYQLNVYNIQAGDAITNLAFDYLREINPTT